MTGAASTPAELLEECDAQGIRLLADGDGGLTIDAPQDALTPELIDRLKTRKEELLTILRPSVDPTDAMERLEGDPLFPADVSDASRAADVRSASPDVAAEPTDDSEAEALGPDGWPVDCIDPDELTACPKCGTLELWQTLADNWRCQRCDPPTKARRLLESAKRIRQQIRGRYWT